MVDEIGGNDYNYALISQGKSFEEVKEMVPAVVRTIKDSVTVFLSTLTSSFFPTISVALNNYNHTCCRELLVMELDRWLFQGIFQ